MDVLPALADPHPIPFLGRSLGTLGSLPNSLTSGNSPHDIEIGIAKKGRFL
jgi:hypothetical protein